MTVDKVSIIGVGTGASAVAAMKSGQIDGMSNFDPAILLLERDELLVPVVDSRTPKGLDELYGGPIAGSSFYVTDDFIKKNPRTTQAFVNAIVKAMHWLDKASIDDIVNDVPHGVLRRRRPRGLRQDDRTQSWRFHQGWPYQAGLGRNHLPHPRRRRTRRSRT